jgi:hypothetical protein
LRVDGAPVANRYETAIGKVSKSAGKCITFM